MAAPSHPAVIRSASSIGHKARRDGVAALGEYPLSRESQLQSDQGSVEGGILAQHGKHVCDIEDAPHVSDSRQTRKRRAPWQRASRGHPFGCDCSWSDIGKKSVFWVLSGPKLTLLAHMPRLWLYRPQIVNFFSSTGR